MLVFLGKRSEVQTLQIKHFQFQTCSNRKEIHSSLKMAKVGVVCWLFPGKFVGLADCEQPNHPFMEIRRAVLSPQEDALHKRRVRERKSGDRHLLTQFFKNVFEGIPGFYIVDSIL